MTSLVLATAFLPNTNSRVTTYSQELVATVSKRVEQLYGETELIFCEDFDGSIKEKVQQADRVIIAGGVDITPHFYRQEVGYPFETRHYEKSDELQIQAVDVAVENSIPLLGICRGLQIINVALGGSLKPDLDDLEGVHQTDFVTTGVMASHSVKLNQFSKFAYALDSTQITVQSQHHQSIDVIGHGLRNYGNAHCDSLSYVIEAVEHTAQPVFGVQWHPEDKKSNHQDFDRLLTLIK